MRQGRVRSRLILSAAVLVAIGITGCSISNLNDSSGTARGGLAVNSPIAATISIDGRVAGEANSLISGLDPGLHLVEARDSDGHVLLSTSYELEPYDVAELWTDSPDFDCTTGIDTSEPVGSDGAADRGLVVASTKADAVISTALGLRGVAKYAHKYAPPQWFDCSGFTYYVFKQNGVNLGTKSDTKQAKLGTYVARAQLTKGDLVFFSSTKSGPGHIGHVGIYEGSDQFVHIFKPGETVAVSKLNGSTWWSSHYITARRVLR